MKYFDTDNMYKPKRAGFTVTARDVKQAINALYGAKKEEAKTEAIKLLFPLTEPFVMYIKGLK